MGVPRLKIKNEIRYRQGSTCETRNCKWCANIVRNFQVIGIGGVDLGLQTRCKIVGLGMGRGYRINEDFTCDRQVTTYKPPVIGKQA